MTTRRDQKNNNPERKKKKIVKTFRKKKDGLNLENNSKVACHSRLYVWLDFHFASELDSGDTGFMVKRRW